ncbi:hypothetical protein BRC67_02435 [Halobacteriales archaeon QH_3_68_24]|nr:MAG: hypothetical protein BRC67_02435 [Halobacteriales archaeon QH_3_68_24]
MSPTRIQAAATLLAALPLVPVTLYIVDQSTAYVALSLVSVLLVVGSLYLMFGPDHDADAA